MQKIAAPLCLLGCIACLLVVFLGVIPFRFENLTIRDVLDATVDVIRNVGEFFYVLFSDPKALGPSWAALTKSWSMIFYLVSYYVILCLCIKKFVESTKAAIKVISGKTEEKERHKEMKQGVLTFNKTTLYCLTLLSISALIYPLELRAVEIVILALLAVVNLVINFLAMFSLKLNVAESAIVSVSRALLLFVIPMFVIQLRGIDLFAMNKFFRLVCMVLYIILLAMLIRNCLLAIGYDKQRKEDDLDINSKGIAIVFGAFYLFYTILMIVKVSISGITDLWYIIKPVIPFAVMIVVEMLSSENAKTQRMDVKFEEGEQVEQLEQLEQPEVSSQE